MITIKTDNKYKLSNDKEGFVGEKERKTRVSEGMGLLAIPSVITAPATVVCCWNWKSSARGKRLLLPSNPTTTASSIGVRAFFPNPDQQPILKEALKEPVAFVGGIFAGLLRLDLNEEPLREWVARTVEASGMRPEENSGSSSKRDGEEEMVQQIDIE